MEDWLPGSPAPVWEVHPEISFAVADGAPLSLTGGRPMAIWA
jgi:hypothetical protein